MPSVLARTAAACRSASEMFICDIHGPRPMPMALNQPENGAPGWAATGATTHGSRINGMTNAPVRHMPIAPTDECP